MSMIDTARTRWENFNPRHRRWIMVGGGILAMCGVISIFAGEGERTPKNTVPDKPVTTGLTDQNLKDITLDSLVAQLQKFDKDKDDLSRKLDVLSREMEASNRPGLIDEKIKSAVGGLQSQVDELRSSGVGGAGPNYFAQAPGESSGQESRKSTSRERYVPERSKADPNPVREAFSRNPAVATGPDGQGPEIRSSGRGERQKAPAPMQIRTYQEKEDETAKPKAADEETVYLPPASIVTVALINGMDAPTSQGARRDPFPAIVRVQYDAILPNRFKADIVDCHAIISGFGDLSSERAYLRGERISCVRNDGQVVEAALDAYAVGEDGKAGIRGRLVSKQGSIVARSLLAGVASGAAEAFNVSPIPVLQTGNVGSTKQYQQNYSPDMVQGAAASGASSALERIAQFYIDMAENIFPVIEVDAGRQIELVLSKGAELKFSQVKKRNPRERR
ncbi:TrbI/VirB10 family protein [Pseudomonas sp. LTJR-52]|uniref:TrbI/VirB10 family protein n=1 Tax=Pseudomonas sp. LTJR-52 TaxID=2479392 RepID=UPI001C49A84B|nr:TrbI/VirB10 family protein [Pseudomonas sp. LTJR-52]